MDKFKKAFSLLELLIVIAVIAIILSLGTYALISFRNYTQVQSAYTEFASLLNTTRNKARNASLSNSKLELTGSVSESIPDYYGILIYSDHEYSEIYCEDSVSSSVNCFRENEIASTTLPQNLSISSDNCEGIIYKKLSGDMFRIVNSNKIETTGECSITFKHTQTSEQRRIFINLTQNVSETI